MNNKQNNSNSLSSKWGDNSLKLGWVAIPSALIFLQAELRISPVGMNVLLNLILHWWTQESKPHPSQDAMAARMGISKRTIQREIAHMVKLGVLKKHPTGIRHPQYRGRNIYDLSPLIKMLNDLSPALVYSLKKHKHHETTQEQEQEQEQN